MLLDVVHFLGILGLLVTTVALHAQRQGSLQIGWQQVGGAEAAWLQIGWQ